MTIKYSYKSYTFFKITSAEQITLHLIKQNNFNLNAHRRFIAYNCSCAVYVIFKKKSATETLSLISHANEQTIIVKIIFPGEMSRQGRRLG